MEKVKSQSFIRFHLVVLNIIVLLVWSCGFNKEQNKTPIASVSDKYLYYEDIKDILPKSADKTDSAAIINTYINRWALEQLLLGQAKLNLPIDTQEDFQKMVKEYERNLYTEAYKNNFVAKQLDSTVSDTAIQSYYEKNKENFHLNNQLLKVRYVALNKEYSDLDEVKERLNRFDEEDKEELTRKSYQFRQINLNDSVWIRRDVLLADFPFIKESVEELKKDRFLELQDSIGVYLLKVEDVLERNDVAPLAFIKPTIRQILLNAQKLELIKKLEKDITEDAIKNKKFQIYAP
ncbi:MAG TPA: peptidylprolyl isomerase [Flavobacteriaceae bacterium]|nr:peptidylprolyl isomerase [Flavobacteriaceae bacterium]